MMTLRVVARIKAKPNKVEEVREVLIGLVAPTRKEAGCTVYELLQNTDDPTDFTFVEEWESEAALASHAASEHIRATREKLNWRMLLEQSIANQQSESAIRAVASAS